jgi:hypothetical protein
MVKLVKIKDEEYDIIDQGADNFHRIVLNSNSPWPNVVFQFGAVKLFEENDSLRVSFEYEVFENIHFLNTKSEEFIDYIGHILVSNLEELLLYNKYQKEQNGV